MMTLGDENPLGSTKMSGIFLNVLQHGRGAVKYMDVFYNPLGGRCAADATYQSRLSN
jgi:hypothetical protein